MSFIAVDERMVELAVFISMFIKALSKYLDGRLIFNVELYDLGVQTCLHSAHTLRHNTTG